MTGSPQSFDGINQNLSSYYCIDSPGNNTPEAVYSINRYEVLNNETNSRNIFI